MNPDWILLRSCWIGTWTTVQSCYSPTSPSRLAHCVGGVMCPNLGHPALSSSFTKTIFLQVKIVCNCQIKKNFSFRMVIYHFCNTQHLKSALTFYDEGRAGCRTLPYCKIIRLLDFT